MQPNETKPTPPADLSLKYMAWDIKQIAKSLPEIVAALDRLTGAVAGSKSQRRDEVPF